MGYFELFGDCYPELQLSRGMFVQLLDIGGCTVFEHKENGDIVGFAVVKDNSLRLICVSEKYRRQGIGLELLAQAEEHIGKEHNEIILGGASGLFIGAPVSKENFDKRSFPFFEKRGYAFDDGCAEMELLLDDFSASEHDLPVAENVTFGYIDGTSEALKKAVEETVAVFRRLKGVLRLLRRRDSLFLHNRRVGAFRCLRRSASDRCCGLCWHCSTVQAAGNRT